MDKIQSYVDNFEDDEVEEVLKKTPFSESHIDDYANKVANHTFLEAKEEQELIALVQAGNTAKKAILTKGLKKREKNIYLESITQGDRALEKLLAHNQRLILSLAGKHLQPGYDLMELVQEGNLALMHAIELFDFSKQTRLTTYATNWIKAGITRYLHNTARSIRKPVYREEMLSKINRREKKLEQELGRIPTRDELAANLGITTEELMEHRGDGEHILSLSYSHDEEGQALEDQIKNDAPSAEDQVILGIIQDGVRDILNTLESRELYILKRRYGFESDETDTLETLSQELDLTREGVRQIEKKTLAKLKNDPRVSNLFEMLG